MRSCIVVFVFTIFSIIPVSGLIIIKLNGKWAFDAHVNRTVKATSVPGGVYSSLYHLHLLNDPYIGTNDITSRQVGGRSWKFSKYVKVNKNVLEKKGIYLVLYGVDTFCKIFVNFRDVGTTNNMFVRYKFNVKNVIHEGTNIIEAECRAPLTMARERFDVETKMHNNTYIPPLCPPKVFNGECYINHMRKQQSSFSWEGGPAMPSVGIWKDVMIEAYNGAILRDIQTKLASNPDGTWKVTVKTDLEGIPNTQLFGNFSIILDSLSKPDHYLEVSRPMKIALKSSYEFSIIQNIRVHKHAVQLWWPNGYGEQKLYFLTCSFKSLNETTKKIIRIGFREVELVQHSIGNAGGLSFYFKINDIPIFMKGANWLPIHSLPEIGESLAGKAKIKRMLEDVKLANMNMLRIWAGGVYESDYFYNLADELGICIWQQFMFDSAMYPASDDFLRNVRVEVVQQVKRLQYHPSLIIWAGNNKNELALRNNWFGTAKKMSMFKDDYVKLYVKTIKETVQKLDITRPFVVSSPSNGQMAEYEDFVSNNPCDTLYGDVHFFEKIPDAWNPNLYPEPRFISEYGFKSLPNYRTLFEASENPPVDLQADSKFLEHRFHHVNGYMEMAEQILRKFYPAQAVSEEITFKALIYHSQIVQAMAVKIQTEKYRQLRSKVLDTGEGMTMGAIYWHLNDMWQAPSASSIDFAGRWKMLHYYARNFFAPVIVSGVITITDELQVYITSDLLYTIPNATLRIAVYKWESFTPARAIHINVEVKPAGSILVYQSTLDEVFRSYMCNREKCFIYLALLKMKRNGKVEFVKNAERVSPDNFVLPATLKDIYGLDSPTIEVKVTSLHRDKNENTTIVYNLEVISNCICPFVWLQTALNGYFSDNGFFLVVPKKYIEFFSNLTVDTSVLQNSISISTLRYTAHLQ